VLAESRDYLGALTDVERCDASGRRLPGASDAELAVMQVSLGVMAAGRGGGGGGSLILLMCCLFTRCPRSVSYFVMVDSWFVHGHKCIR
jgi:hypothetical protein